MRENELGGCGVVRGRRSKSESRGGSLYKALFETKPYARYATGRVHVEGLRETLPLQATVGAKILDLCKFGDDVVAQKCASVFAKGKNKIKEKGIAFPTCVSVNECPPAGAQKGP